MTDFKRIVATSLLASLIFAVGCQPEPNRNNRRFGRNAYGASTQRPINASTQATRVTNSSDTQMTNVANLFAAPALSSNPEWALGNVSSQNGVTMWAEAYIIGGNGVGSIDGSRSRIHVEVSDSRVGQPDGAGGTLPPFVMHIGYDQVGFERAEGGVTDGSVALRFDQAGYGSVFVTGTNNGNTLTGQLAFTNTATNGEMVVLGNFSVPLCSFFVCQ